MNKEKMDIILLVVQIFSLIFLIVYVVQTWRMAVATKRAAEASEKTLQEMKAMRDQETAPYIIVYFEIPSGTSLIYLIIKNIGKTIAKDLTLDFNPPLKSSNQGVEINDLAMIKYGIASLAPGQELRTFFDGAIGYFGRKDLPQYVLVKVSYTGGLQEGKRKHEQTLDIQAFKGLLYTHEKNMNDLVSQVEKLTASCSNNHSDLQLIVQTLKKGLNLDKATKKKYGWRPRKTNLV